MAELSDPARRVALAVRGDAPRAWPVVYALASAGFGLDLVVTEASVGAPLPATGDSDGAPDQIGARAHGADDFVARPFAVAELVARCRALVRRARAPTWSGADIGVTDS